MLETTFFIFEMAIHPGFGGAVQIRLDQNILYRMLQYPVRPTAMIPRGSTSRSIDEKESGLRIASERKSNHQSTGWCEYTT